MEISLKAWIEYIDQLRRVNDKAAELVRKYLEKNSIPQTSGELDALIKYAYKVSTTMGEASSAAAAQMYDNIARAAKVSVPAAEPAATPTYGEVAKTINGMLKHNHSEDAIGSSIGRLVKRTGVDTTMKNALRDGAEFAWVPHGDTCSFCIMLASNGWQRASKDLIKRGHAEHIHANCDCTFAIRFDGKSGVEGYNPQVYKDMYDSAPGDNWKDKLNYMDKEYYELTKDERNARKRELYAENQDKSFKNKIKDLGLKPFDEPAKNGIINIEIDEFTPCLRDSKTGELVDTTVGVVEDRKVLKGYNTKTGWYINWQKVPDDCTVLALRIKGSDEIQGLVAFKNRPDISAVEGHWAVANPKSNKQFTNEPEYKGIGGHLFAAMADASVKAGYDGFIYGKAANKKLLNHYIEAFGAVPVGDLKFYIDEKAAKDLLNKYNWEGV